MIHTKDQTEVPYSPFQMNPSNQRILIHSRKPQLHPLYVQTPYRWKIGPLRGASALTAPTAVFSVRTGTANDAPTVPAAACSDSLGGAGRARTYSGLAGTGEGEGGGVGVCACACAEESKLRDGA